MHLSHILALLLFSIFASADPAPVSKDSPPDVQYAASFQREGLSGLIAFTSFQGYVFCFGHVTGLPPRGLPYSYTIHQRPVPPDFNCRRTLGVLDPYDGQRNAQTMAEYRVGDLSGKHGKATTTTLVPLFIDPYISLNPENPAFIGDKSVVILASDGRRSVCASIERTKENVPMSKEMQERAQKILDELHLA